MPKTRTKTKIPGMSVVWNDPDVLLREWASIQSILAMVREDVQWLHDRLRDYILANGTQDAQGTWTVVHGDLLLQWQARHGVKVDESEASALLARKRKLHDYSKHVVTAHDLERAVQNNVVSPSEAERVIQHSLTHALVIRENPKAKRTKKAAAGRGTTSVKGIVFAPD